MNCLLALLLAVSVLASPAGAAELRLLLSPTGLSDEADTNSPIAGAPTQSNPVVDVTGGPQRLYIWAQIMGSPPIQTWHVVGLDFRTTGAARITERRFWNYSVGGERWDWISQGSLDPAGRMVTGVGLGADTARGVNNSAAAQSQDGQYDAETNAALIGYLAVDGAGELFIGVGPFGIHRLGADGPEPIHFGFGDEGDAIDGDDFGTYSSLADARTESRLGVDGAGGRRTMLRCIPNPSPGATVRILYDGPRGQDVELSITDLNGRLVVRLPLQTSIEWTGRDRLGRPVSPGVYVAGVHAAGRLLASRRLVVVR